MKCWYYTKHQKNKVSTTASKEMQDIVAKYMRLSLAVGHKRALEIMEEEKQEYELLKSHLAKTCNREEK